jgi:hypothetical protein
MSIPDYEAIERKPMWTLKDIAVFFGYSYKHVSLLSKRPGFPKPQGDSPRFPQQRVRQFMIDLGRQGRERRIKQARGRKPSVRIRQELSAG